LSAVRIRRFCPNSSSAECVRLPAVPPKRKSKPRNLELAALAKAIEEQMAEKGMRQKDLSEASGIDVRRIGDYVRGRYGPNLANLRRLCRALDLTVDAFLDRAGELEKELSDG
jgi:ribosome-binding protein aMBF1 (putative translation factor)